MIILFLVIKNEATYLDEFIQYYLGSGFDKILILDDKSTDNTKEVVKPYVEMGKVDYYYETAITPIAGLHREKYRNIYLEKYDEFCFIFLDIDEFLFVKGMNINNLVDTDEFKLNDNLNIQEAMCFREQNTPGLTTWNPYTFNILYQNKPNCSKPLIKLYKNKNPLWLDGHRSCYEQSKAYNPCKFNIGFWHLKPSLDEMLFKQKFYEKAKSNPYYRNANEVKKKHQERIKMKLGKNFTVKMYSAVVFKQFYQKYNFFIIRKLFPVLTNIGNLYTNSQLHELATTFEVTIGSIHIDKNINPLPPNSINLLICSSNNILINNFILNMGDVFIYSSSYDVYTVINDCIQIQYIDFKDMDLVDTLYDAFNYNSKHTIIKPQLPIKK